ncbi:MAG: UDP-glucose--hexose-1-phosphate uridylyltransferase [Bacilli bacterium]
MKDIQLLINELYQYSIDKQLINKSEKYYSINLLLDILNLDEYIEINVTEKRELEEILKDLLDWAESKNIIPSDSIIHRDLLDTKIMNCFVPRPDTVTSMFFEKYEISPLEATNWYYDFSKNTDYIRAYRVKKDLRWESKTFYGNIDITINLSKPEKDPKAIAALKNAVSANYPKCQLCQENMGYRGRVNHPARETIRLIPLKFQDDDFFLQYSPYGYYNEHCIVFNAIHKPMAIDHACFSHLISFVTMFPHYMLGSNADLPIVGGSILSHDHYQGGRYTFPMFKAKEALKVCFSGYENVQASFLSWPVSVLRIKSENSSEILSLSDKILAKWREYDDPERNIFAFTDGVPHSTITPILHKENNLFVMDLALRNNITSAEYPLGVYHPHQEYWNIKKENIGLIEVMGTAVLPSRLKTEMSALEKHILGHEDIAADPLTEKHEEWVKGFIGQYAEINPENIHTIIQNEIGKVFTKVLECAGVFKQNESGLEGIRRFVSFVNSK